MGIFLLEQSHHSEEVMKLIMYVEVVNRKIIIHTDKETIEDSLTRQLERILMTSGYVRINQNQLVSLNAISSVNSNILLSNGEELFASRRNMKKVTSFFDMYSD